MEKNDHQEQAGGEPAHGDEMISGLMGGVKLGDPIRHEGLSIFPLFTPDGHEPAYELLEDALASETAFITEASESGSVPELLIDNHSEKPILILEGDVLIGAKQNRVVNLTVLVPPLMKFVLPVSCVERGRWSYMSKHFSVKRSANPDLRRSKISSVMRCKRTTGRPVSDQMDVWNKVDACLEGLSADSPTESLEDGYAASEQRLGAYRDKVRLPEGATGFLVATGGKVVGMDLFGEAVTASRCWGRLSESYFIEALRSEPEERSEEREVSKGQALDFMCGVGSTARLCEKASGLGREIEVETENLAGMGLAWEGRLVHLAAFALD